MTRQLSRFGKSSAGHKIQKVALMRFRIVSDSSKEAGLDEVRRALNAGKFEEYFEDRCYDDSGIRLGTVLMCRDPQLHFKQRISFSKKDNTLHIDVMLDFESMVMAATTERRLRVVGAALLSEVPRVIAKYKFRNFDLSRFASDLRSWFELNGWLPPEAAPTEIG